MKSTNQEFKSKRIMTKSIRISITIFISSLSLISFGQQTPLFGFNSQMLNISNPSLSRSVSPLNVTLAGRKYWTGIQNSPEAFLGSFSLSPSQYKSAFGGFFWAEKAPMISKQVVGLNYAYSIKNMDEDNNLRFGAGLDFISISSNTSSILTNDYNDPYYTALFNNTRSAVDFRAGATWNNEKLEIGLAMQQLIKSKNTLGESVNGKLVYNNSMITNGHIKYSLQPSEDFKITPLVFWQIQKSIPMRVDINLLAEKTGKLWGGLWLRPKSAYGIMAGLWALPDVKIGYMYEKTFLRKISKAGNSHELLISYTPSFASKAKTDDKDLDKTYKEKPEPEVVRIRDTIVIVKETRVIETPKKTEPTPAYTPKDEPKETIKPAPKPATPTVAAGKFYVVTGLFSLEANAKNYSKKLQAEGYKTSLVKNPTANQYYVSVGNFNSLDEAHQYITANPSPNFKFWVKEIK